MPLGELLGILYTFVPTSSGDMQTPLVDIVGSAMLTGRTNDLAGMLRNQFRVFRVHLNSKWQDDSNQEHMSAA